MKSRNIIGALLVVVILAACVPTAKVFPTATTQEPTLITTPIPSMISPVQYKATATAFRLPWNEIPNDTTGYCASAPMQLPASDAHALDDDEIAKKLIGAWLAYFGAAKAPGDCRVDDYRIDQVFANKAVFYAAMEPKGDFMRTVWFSVKLIQIPVPG